MVEGCRGLGACCGVAVMSGWRLGGRLGLGESRIQGRRILSRLCRRSPGRSLGCCGRFLFGWSLLAEEGEGAERHGFCILLRKCTIIVLELYIMGSHCVDI